MTQDGDEQRRPVTRGDRADVETPEAFAAAIRAALDYRGDVSLAVDGRDGPVVGFVFDVARGEDGAGQALRVLPADGGARLAIPVSSVRAIEFTGKDAAAGKSFDTWVKKYLAKKAAGEPANLEAEPLDEHA